LSQTLFTRDQQYLFIYMGKCLQIMGYFTKKQKNHKTCFCKFVKAKTIHTVLDYFDSLGKVGEIMVKTFIVVHFLYWLVKLCDFFLWLSLDAHQRTRCNRSHCTPLYYLAIYAISTYHRMNLNILLWLK
jgi:hypothetical protein